ncbi:HU family DNA-binding protein [Carboxylicivirga sp. RSCT41]|uniref:HU family DNA-binding protein n=1 Tax=Carboxylicivirga agarovorans TaxID=3417570 RepID=UPI003D32625F
MVIKYRVQQRVNPQNKNESKYYVKPVHLGTIKRAQLEQEITSLTSLTKSDVQRVLLAFSDLLCKYLMQGYYVEINNVGTLSLRTCSESSTSPEEVSPFKVKNIGIRFKPAGDLNEEIQTIKFERI